MYNITLCMRTWREDLLLFFSYLASQNKEIRFGNYFFMCVV